MIYLFFWEKHFRDKLINSWKNSFAEKYSDLNIFHVKNTLDYDFNFYSQNLLWGSFFASKKLFIIDDFSFKIWEKDDNILKYEEFFLNILDKVWDENIVVFNNENADKRSKLFKKIEKIWEIKDFSIKDNLELKEKLRQVYGEKVSLQAINKIIELKWESFLAIENEFEKLFLTKDFVDVWDLSEVLPSVEQNIFDIINLILNLDTKLAIKKLRELSQFLDNPFLLYNMIISNLRIYFYIFYLKNSWIQNNKISEVLNLWNRWFLVWKNYKISFEKFVKMYEKLLKIDEKLKTWKLLWSWNEEFMYEMEKSLVV